MNSKTMVAGLAMGSLLISAGIHATQSVRAESGASPTSQASEMSGWHEACQAPMASMMWMMHQHQGMLGDGAPPSAEPTPAPPSTGPGMQAPAPDASLGAGHDQHHPSASPVVSPGPS